LFFNFLGLQIYCIATRIFPVRQLRRQERQDRTNGKAPSFNKSGLPLPKHQQADTSPLFADPQHQKNQIRQGRSLVRPRTGPANPNAHQVFPLTDRKGTYMERGLLHLTRKVGERVVIQVEGYPPIFVSVSDKNRNSVMMTFDSPKTIRVDREEVYLERVCGQ
jgi:sRNA-binding carbon storage regulator CsrA